LVFEDDAVPIRSDWLKIIEESSSLLNDFEVVSFHGRGHDLSSFVDVEKNKEYIQPICKGIWVVAALSYLIREDCFERLCNYEYDGTPFDLLLYWNFNYCLAKNTPFLHDRSEGSLVD